METTTNTTATQTTAPLLEKKGLIKSLLLSIITLGIYFFWWVHNIIKKIKLLNGEDAKWKGELVLVMLVPFYCLHWAKTRGAKLSEAAAKHGIVVNNNSGFYLFISFFFGFGLVIAMMQNDLNMIATVLGSKEAPETAPEAVDYIGEQMLDVELDCAAAPEDSASVYVDRAIAAPSFLKPVQSGIIKAHSKGNETINQIKALHDGFVTGKISETDYNSRKAELINSL